MQQKIEELCARYHLPALAVAVARGDDSDIHVTGIRKAGHDVPVTADDVFHGGSCGKSITAMLARACAQPDDVLADLLPDMAMHDFYKSMTLFQLLTHSAGMPANYPDLNKLRDMEAAMSLPDIRWQMMSETLAQPPEGGTRGVFQYSNLGYILLGVLVEKKAGNAFESLVRQQVFEKMGMSSAGFGCAANENAEKPNQPWGHIHHQDHKLEPVWGDNPAAYAPAGMIYAALRDWLKFFQHLSKYIATQHEGAPLMGIGPSVYTALGLAYKDGIYSHDGSNTLNYMRVLLRPEASSVFVMACNDASENSVSAIDEITGIFL
ncbi:MAG: serine hydrolase [Alphaproteobacteria bacterium]|nr:serine hydrolase [Alphaproteobacteria bacterium]